jgi:hypothetical protein
VIQPGERESGRAPRRCVLLAVLQTIDWTGPIPFPWWSIMNPMAHFDPDVDGPNLDFQLRCEVAALVAAGMDISEAASLVGIPAPDRLPADPPFTPTPEMIRRHCQEIQALWAPGERASRNAWKAGPVETAQYWVGDLWAGD